MTTLADRGGVILRGYSINQWRLGQGNQHGNMVLKVEEIRLGINAHIVAAQAAENRKAILAWAKSVGLEPYMLLLGDDSSGIPYVVVPIQYFESRVLPELIALREAPAVKLDETEKAGDPAQVRFARIARWLMAGLIVLVFVTAMTLYAGISVDAKSSELLNVINISYFIAIGLIAGMLYCGHRAAGSSQRRALLHVAALALLFGVVLPGLVSRFTL